MREETIKVFAFDELGAEAKERVRDTLRSWPDLWSWQKEWEESAEAFSAIAPIRIGGARFDHASVDVDWTGDDAVGDLSGLRAWKWLNNNGWFDLAAKNAQGSCTLTGFMGDCSLFDPIHRYAADPLNVPTLWGLFYSCAQSWVCEARQDLEWSYSDEHIDEMAHANFEFLADGRIYHGAAA